MLFFRLCLAVLYNSWSPDLNTVLQSRKMVWSSIVIKFPIWVKIDVSVTVILYYLQTYQSIMPHHLIVSLKRTTAAQDNSLHYVQYIYMLLSSSVFLFSAFVFSFIQREEIMSKLTWTTN